MYSNGLPDRTALDDIRDNIDGTVATATNLCMNVHTSNISMEQDELLLTCVVKLNSILSTATEDEHTWIGGTEGFQANQTLGLLDSAF